MAYATTGLHLAVSVAEGPSIWTYQSADVVGDVDATDYFSDASDRGMAVGDVVHVYDSTTPLVTDCWVSAIDSDGNGTITQQA